MTQQPLSDEKKCSVFQDKTIVGSAVLHLSALFVLLFCFWLLLTGTFETKFLIYGVLTALIVSWVSYPVLLVPYHGKKYFLLSINPFRFINYFCWLMYQLVLANIDVVRATVRPEIEIHPSVVRFYFRAEHPLAQVILANSITLTPGTVTLNVTPNGVFEIHALTTGAAEGIISGDFPKKVAWLFNEPCHFFVIEV